LLVFSLICDFIYYFGGRDEVWAQVAYYTLGGGIIGALVAAVPGFIDLLSIRDPGHKRLGIVHMCFNLVAVVLLVTDFWLRREQGTWTGSAFSLSIIGVGMLAVSGWLGADLVHIHGIGVATRAEADAATREADSEVAGSEGERTPRGFRKSTA
jgi:uncharacterized membrane protein